MKCIYCGSDTKYPVRARNGGRCGACSHPFAFEPRTDPLKMADGLFQRILKDVSGEGKVFFTERQLWYELNRRLLRRKVVSCGGAAMLCLVSALAALALHRLWPTTLGASGLLFGAVTGPKRARNTEPRYPRVEFGTFTAAYLAKWVQAHGAIATLLPPSARNVDGQPRQMPAELTAYSFDRALITDSAEMAAMLVANNFHFENNCAILSVDGYPYHNADVVMEMLRRNPQLSVFALHNASIPGCLMPQTLRQERWFPDRTIRILDLGLRPQHAQKMNLILNRQAARPLPPELDGSLTPEEKTWLASGVVAELAAMRPAKLMRAVYQGFARANQMSAGTTTAGSDSIPVGDSFSGQPDVWIVDGGPAMDVYAADSFG